MEVVGDIVIVQQNERSNEEGERKGERGSNTLCRHEKSHREKKKKLREETEGIVLNTSAEEMYLSVCGKRRSLLPSVKRK